jgi:hypothetical protein
MKKKIPEEVVETINETEDAFVNHIESRRRMRELAPSSRAASITIVISYLCTTFLHKPNYPVCVQGVLNFSLTTMLPAKRDCCR